MPGVRLVPGGVVRPPGAMTSHLDVHFGEGLIPACMAETILIAADRAYDRVSLGASTKSENVEYFVRRAAELGFTLAEESPRTAPEPGRHATVGSRQVKAPA